MSEGIIVRRGGEAVQVRANLKVFAPQGSHVVASCGGRIWQGDVSGINPSGIPDDYQEVEYLQSTGTQILDIGPLPSNITTAVLKLKYKCDSMPSNSPYVYGYHQNENRYSFNLDTTGNNFVYLFSNSSSSGKISSSFTTDIQDVVITRSGTSATISGTQTGSTTGLNVSLFSNAPHFGLFGLYNGETILRQAPIRIYSASMIINGNNYRNLVPCYRKSDNVAGMYDLVNNLFYTNQGTGTFALGPVISCITFNVTKIGTYIVTATLDDMTATATININLPQEYVVRLAYRLYLFKSGEGNVGNLTKSGYSFSVAGYTFLDATYDTDKAILNANADKFMAVAGTPNKVDLSKYNTLYIDSYGEKGSTASIIYDIYILNNKSIVDATFAKRLTNGTREIQSVDISSYNTEMYVLVNEFNGRKATLYNLYLE